MRGRGWLPVAAPLLVLGIASTTACGALGLGTVATSAVAAGKSASTATSSSQSLEFPIYDHRHTGRSRASAPSAGLLAGGLVTVGDYVTGALGSLFGDAPDSDGASALANNDEFGRVHHDVDSGGQQADFLHSLVELRSGSKLTQDPQSGAGSSGEQTIAAQLANSRMARGGKKGLFDKLGGQVGELMSIHYNTQIGVDYYILGFLIGMIGITFLLCALCVNILISGKSKHYWQFHELLFDESQYKRLRVGDDEREFDGEFGEAYKIQLQKESTSFLPRY